MSHLNKSSSLIYYIISRVSSPKRISDSQQNCPFWTCFSKLSTEDMQVRATVDAESYFLLPISHLCWIESFSRKAVLPRHAESTWLNPSFSLLDFIFSLLFGAASALLASVCMPSSSQCGLGRRSVWASFWFCACTCAPWYCSRSVQNRRLNFAATRASGDLEWINCW